MNRKKITRLVFALFVASLPVLAYWQRYAIYDEIRLYNYKAPYEIGQLANQASMLPSMTKLFFVNHPALEDKATFNNSCKTAEQTIVLGCYIKGNGIHLLKVTDSRLNGVEQVTAAHETLHAAYDRLSTSKRKKVDAMTTAYYATATDQRLKDTIELYRKKDPSVVPNELHSILGTEIRSLPKDLENYYKRYFYNRLEIVSFSEKYEQAFTDRKNQISSYDEQLTSLKAQINSLQTSLTNQSASLTSERERLNSLRNSGQISAYNSAVPDFNNRVNQYNRDIDTLSSLVSQYNDIVAKRNEIAAQETELTKAIDSHSIPARQ